MQSYSSKLCTDCKVNAIRDQERGEYFCPRCGKIVQAEIYDLGIESNTYNNTGQTRASVSNYPVYTHLTSTSIDSKNRDVHGKSVGVKSKINVNLLKIWQKRLRVTNIQDKNLILTISEVERICNAFNLSDFIKEQSIILYKTLAAKNFTKGKSVPGLVCAIIYILVIKHKIPVTLEQINRISKVKKRRITKLYRTIIKQQEIKLELPDVNSYINKYISYVHFERPEQTGAFRDLCNEITEYYYAKMQTGKGPLTITCALIYIMAKLKNMEFDLKKFITKVKITRITFKIKVKNLSDLIIQDNKFSFDIAKLKQVTDLKNV